MMEMCRIVQSVKQHYGAVRKTRDRHEPKEAGVSYRISYRTRRADTQRKVNADDHLVIDRVVGRPAPSA